MNACPRLCPFYLYSLFLSILYIFHRLAVIILSESPLAQFSPDMVPYGQTQFVIANRFTESRATCNVMRHVSPVCSQGALSFFAQKLVIANYNLERRTSHQTTSFHPALGTGPSGAVDLVTVSRRDRYKPVRAAVGRARTTGDFSDLASAPPAGDPVYRGRYECGRSDHAAALHEQIRLSHHRSHHLLGPVRHSSGPHVPAKLHSVGTGAFLLRLCRSGYLDLCLVHSAHPVQGRGHGSPGGHHVRQCHRRPHQLSGLPV